MAVNPNGLMPIGAVAAHNIAQSLNLGVDAVGPIETAIRDEINAMSSHFTLAVADVQTQYEVEVAKIKSTYTYVEANVWKVLAIVAGVFALGAATGYLI